MGWLLRNWHLKLGAVALATILYTGLVFSGSFSDETFPGIPVTSVNQPDGTYLLSQQLGSVDVRYRVSTDAPLRITAESFAVTVDLAGYDMATSPEAQSLPIRVRSLVDGMTILSFSPATVSVAIDRLSQRSVRVVVDRGTVPVGLEIGTPVVSDQQVVASGPASLLRQVDRAVARVRIDESGIDVSAQVELVPVDIDGRTVPSVELAPSTVQVDIDVRTVETSKTVPVRPILSGTPAIGFEVASVTVDPAVVTLHGAPANLADITEVLTQPISLAGMRARVSLAATLVIPAGTHLPADGSPPPTVTIQIRETIASRTLLVGVVCTGQPSGSACLPQLSQVAVTVRGTLNAVSALNPATLSAVLSVSGLAPGSHDLVPTVSLPAGIALVGISPGTVTAVIVPPATPAP
jgi:YbbR domain-containing protein